MYRTATATIVIGMLAMSLPVSAHMGGGDAMGVEVARANARAGGPISDHDKDLLERYGCQADDDNAYCRRLRYTNYGSIGDEPYRHERHRHHRNRHSGQ